MATRKAPKASPKHDAHVTEYWHHALNDIAAPASTHAESNALIAAVVEELDLPKVVSLEEALAESNEVLSDLIEEPSAPRRGLSTGRVDKSGVMYAITDKAQKILPIETLQRGCTVTVGAQWRNNEFKATNTRVAAIGALYGAADKEENTLSHAKAMEALAPLKKAATLGSGTPASYIREFVRVGYLEVI